MPRGFLAKAPGMPSLVSVGSLRIGALLIPTRLFPAFLLSSWSVSWSGSGDLWQRRGKKLSFYLCVCLCFFFFLFYFPESFVPWRQIVKIAKVEQRRGQPSLWWEAQKNVKVYRLIKTEARVLCVWNCVCLFILFEFSHICGSTFSPTLSQPRVETRCHH